MISIIFQGMLPLTNMELVKETTEKNLLFVFGLIKSFDSNVKKSLHKAQKLGAKKQ